MLKMIDLCCFSWLLVQAFKHWLPESTPHLSEDSLSANKECLEWRFDEDLIIIITNQHVICSHSSPPKVDDGDSNIEHHTSNSYRVRVRVTVTNNHNQSFPLYLVFAAWSLYVLTFSWGLLLLTFKTSEEVINVTLVGWAGVVGNSDLQICGIRPLNLHFLLIFPLSSEHSFRILPSIEQQDVQGIHSIAVSL